MRDRTGASAIAQRSAEYKSPRRCALGGAAHRDGPGARRARVPAAVRGLRPRRRSAPRRVHELQALSADLSRREPTDRATSSARPGQDHPRQTTATSDATIRGLDARLHPRSALWRTRFPDALDGRRVQPQRPGTRDVVLVSEPIGHQRARQRRGDLRLPEVPTDRQRHGANVKAHAAMVRRTRCRAALYPTRKADSERVHRVLSTGASVPSSSMRTGSILLQRHRRTDTHGCTVTTRPMRTARSAIARPRSSSKPTKLANLHRNQWLHNGADLTTYFE